MKNAKGAWLGLAMIGWTGLAGSDAQSGPSRLPDEEFGRLFFSAINLNAPGLDKVRNLVSQQQYGQAFDAWEQAFVARAAKIKTGAPQLQTLHGRKLAENVSSMTQDRLEQLAAAMDRPATPNQRSQDVLELFRGALMTPEFKRNPFWMEKAEAGLYTLMRGSWQPDGSDSELSYNNRRLGADVVELFENYPESPRWLVELKLKSHMRDLFLKSLATPWGMQVLGDSPTGYGDKPAPGRMPPYAGSIAFPWAGLYVMRQGWGADALFLSLSSPRRGRGREGEQHNFLTLEAYGRRLLIANPGLSANPSEKDYFGSSWAQNTVNVDGCSQNKLRLPPHGAYEDPLPGRWHTSAHFDFAEATYSSGYGTDGKNGVKVAEVTHERQVIFVRDAKLWIITDTMNALSNAEHEYSQLWHFTKDLPHIVVVPDEERQRVGTRDPKVSNLFIYHAGIPAVLYQVFYGQGDPAAKANANGIKARGWHNTGEAVFPSVEVDAVWKGRGRQKLVTVLAPSPDASDPVTSFEKLGRPGAAGFKLITQDGTQVQYASALVGTEQLTLDAGTVQGEALLVVKQGDNSRGLFLAPMGSAEFELSGGEARAVLQVKPPNGFRWLEDGRLRPDYTRR